MGHIKYKLTIAVSNGSESEYFYYSIDELDKENGYFMVTDSIGIKLSPNNRTGKYYSVKIFPYANIIYYDIEYKKLEEIRNEE